MTKYYYFYFCMVFSLFFSSCKKEAPIVNALIGQWELSISVDGMTGKATKAGAGSGNLLRIAKKSYERYEKGQLVESGSYSIVQENSILYHKKLDRIVFNDEYDMPRTFIKIESDQLTIWIDAFDAPSVVYKKVVQ
ncbi:hypothetical protein [Desertivirga arenae]|uniref:hypothetical protein n=1 Tax=Desertivirga arenae TaxID=2810309 RepID=UPI001A95653B|nr:hypothetical protein [Pedobacter sp. SYSU D00823]